MPTNSSIFTLIPDTNPNDTLIATVTISGSDTGFFYDKNRDGIIDYVSEVNRWVDQNYVTQTDTINYKLTWSDTTHWVANRIENLAFGPQYDNQGRPTTTMMNGSGVPIVWQSRDVNNVIATISFDMQLNDGTYAATVLKLIDSNADNIPDSLSLVAGSGPSAYVLQANLTGWTYDNSHHPTSVSAVFQTSTKFDDVFSGSVIGTSTHPTAIIPPSFFGNGVHNDGRVITDFGGFEVGNSVAVQSDGKIVVAGGTGNDFALVRYNTNGTLDTSFSGDGKLTTDINTGSSDNGLSVGIQSDGKIVLAGKSNGDFAVVRYNTDGSLDTSFSGDGKLTTDFGGTDAARSMTIQSDGKIVVAGASNGDIAVVRYNSNGTLDTSFSGDGKLTTDFGGTDTGNSVTVQSDGKIVVAGDSNGDFAVVRYNTNGTLDTSFSGDGKLTTDFGGTDTGNSVRVQSDGKIVVAGASNGDIAVVRYNSNGTLDTSFSGDGKLTTDFGGFDTGYSVAVQSDGKIVVAGTNNLGDFVVVRYNSDGNLDTSFSGDGKLNTHIGVNGSNDVAKSVTVQSDGKIIVSGGSSGDVALVRYNGDGTLDTSFTGAYYPDTTPPTLSTAIPSDGSTGTPVTSDIKLTFTEAFVRGTGWIEIHSGSANGPLVERFDVATSNNLYIWADSQLGIHPSSNLALGTHYFVTLASGSIKDFSGNSFAGTTTYDFTTALSDPNIGTAANDVLTGTAGNDSMYGYAGNDNISALAGNDFIDGGTGNDTMVGGLGDDTYLVDSAGDVVTELASQGTDTVNSSITYTLGANVENLYLNGLANINGTGNALDNTICGNNGNNILTGGAGNDFLNGGLGNDTMIGGIGNDTYLVDSSGDVVTELASEGTDTVQSSISYTLGANVENLYLNGLANINGTGNALDNSISGNSGNNILTGGAGNDFLNGGLGNDTMIGGIGNDTYLVDSSGDVVTEFASEGTDTVQSSISYTLGANVENLGLSGTAAINGTGNALDNNIHGNSGNNILTGGAGNDFIDGGSGNDTMVGGLGNDTYLVDSAGDVVTELASEGIDHVQSSITYTLGANVENLGLSGTASINGTGNALDNSISGNSGNNILTGGAGNDFLNGGLGNDTMVGGTGNDVYTVDSAGDVVTELASEGIDHVQSSITYTLGANVENLGLSGTASINGTGNALDNSISGNSNNNILNGGAGNDFLNGGLGNDSLIGGAGSDYFAFNTAPNATTNKDTITDFVTGVDKLQFSKAVFTGLGSIVGNISAAQFWSGAGVVAAHDADDRIVYNTTTGALYYDGDGAGGVAAVQVALLGTVTHPTLAYTDITIGA